MNALRLLPCRFSSAALRPRSLRIAGTVFDERNTVCQYQTETMGPSQRSMSFRHAVIPLFSQTRYPYNSQRSNSFSHSISMLRSSTLSTTANVYSSTSTKRHISLLHKTTLSPSLLSDETSQQIRSDLDDAIALVREYDPAGYAPGLLLVEERDGARLGYFALHAFLTETGFRKKALPAVSGGFGGLGVKPLAVETVEERLDWWEGAIEFLYMNNDESATGTRDTRSEYLLQPTVRLLRYAIRTHELSRTYFDEILTARRRDATMKQYPDMNTHISIAHQLYGSLLHLTLECNGYRHPQPSEASIDTTNAPDANLRDVCRDVGICLGITNSLRATIPLVGTGKITIPTELTCKYGIRNPRYALSLLGKGDVKCQRSMSLAVKDMVAVARFHLARARESSGTMEESTSPAAISCLLPALASETFLNRLERADCDLTNEILGNVGFVEHGMCVLRMVIARVRKTY